MKFSVDESQFLRLVRGESRGAGPSLARLGLSGLAVGYRLGAASRALTYDRGWAKTVQAPIPIISIGNLTLGGVGKTPMVEWTARWHRRQGVRVAILSRGYGAGRQGLNDEGLVLEQNLPDVPHLQGRDRSALATIASEELLSQVAILDDGFQHRRLRRDLDVVLLDALDPFGLNRLFPRGLLREPISALRRADLVILSRADLITEHERNEIFGRARRAAPNARWAEARHAPQDLINASGQSQPLDFALGAAGELPSSASSHRIASFCGIGNPEGFRRTLAKVHAPVIAFRAFPDHHDYQSSDVSSLARWAAEQRASLVLTTQKDLVKLQVDALGSIPLFALRIGWEFLEGQELVEEALARLLPAVEDWPDQD